MRLTERGMPAYKHHRRVEPERVLRILPLSQSPSTGYDDPPASRPRRKDHRPLIPPFKGGGRSPVTKCSSRLSVPGLITQQPSYIVHYDTAVSACIQQKNGTGWGKLAGVNFAGPEQQQIAAPTCMRTGGVGRLWTQNVRFRVGPATLRGQSSLSTDGGPKGNLAPATQLTQDLPYCAHRIHPHRNQIRD